HATQELVDPTLMRRCHFHERGMALGSQPHEGRPAITVALRAHDESVLHQPVDDAGDVAVRHQQETGNLAHQHPVRLAIERRHHVETRERDIELRLEALARLALDEPGCAQQPDPQPQSRLAVAIAALGHQWCAHHVSPPETAIACPVTAAAASLQSQSTMSATSFGWTKRACALRFARAARTSASLRLVVSTIRRMDSFSIGGSVKPGHTALTVVPVAANSTARARASPTTPCLAAT